MTTDTRLDQLGERLERSIAAEISSGARAAEPAPTRGRRRPKLLAGGTLGLAGVVAALAIGFGGTGATAPAYAITQSTDGTVLLKINLYGRHTLAAADAKLIDRYHETVLLSAAASTGSGAQGASSLAPGPSTSSAPVQCTPTADSYAPGDPMPSGPRIELLIGKDNTIVIPSGNTGAGTVHLVSCATLVATPGANSGSASTGG